MTDLAARGSLLVGLVAEDAAAHGAEAYELMQLVFAGYPLDELCPLLDSPNTEAVRVGVSILAETASSDPRGLELAEGLLGHSDAKVRYYAIQAVSASGSANHGDTAARAARLIDDPSEPVRRSVVRFLAGAPAQQLEVMAGHLPTTWRGRVDLLLTSRHEGSGSVILEWLERPGADRLIGLAASIRRASVDPVPLGEAVLSQELEVRTLALHEQKLLIIDDEG